ncbi:hypothetical protein AVKW3434_18435 [Acidovorax sp. SUPP3434]|uniref:virulence factor TspB C-terminal domain-related protein n=1 Tax=Acidovorax sp. SUPP3434 TaxID=2920880 RepID=UPI0023DE27A2|nr:virulence factor TspB C-terminal domain-related protein [Acidovorax sp. SUPP3434]GKT01398.1 hypothetical protein AVKW3434_18435 [Acidovorax sp. SUPP3434]
MASPPGFAASPAGFTYAAAANDATYGRVVYQAGGLTANVGGQTTRMAAAYRLAANAPRFAAAAIFLNPYVRAGVGIASLLMAAKVFWDEYDKKWKHRVDEDEVIVRWEYTFPGAGQNFPTATEACRVIVARQTPQGAHVAAYSVSGTKCTGGFSFPYEFIGQPAGYVFGVEFNGIERVQKPCPAGSVPTDAGCVVKGSRTDTIESPEDFAQRIINPNSEPGWTMPDSVPLELPPGTPLPVEQPFINPEPGPSPAHRPLFVPTGNPVPNPKYDPSAELGPNNWPWLQPGVRIVPAPTPGAPTRVDMQPVDRAIPNPDADPDSDPAPEDKPKPEEQQSLCEKHPDIVACQKLGEIEAKELPNRTVPVKLEREEGFGPSNGSCPAPRHLSAMGMDLEFRWDLFCDFASGVRPLVVGFAYLAAVLSFMGLSRKD